MYIYDEEAKKCLYLNSLRSTNLFAIVAHDGSGGITGINSGGKLRIIVSKANSSVQWMRQKLGNDKPVHSIAYSNGFTGIESCFTGVYKI